MIKLKRLNATDFATADTFYRSKDFNKITQDFYNYLYTSALEYLDTGDLNTLNRPLLAAKYANRVRETTKLLQMVSAHTLSNGKFKGKSKTAKLKQLRTRETTVPAEGKPDLRIKARWEAVINAAAAEKEAKQQVFNADAAETRAVNALAALLAHHVNIDVAALLKQAEVQATTITAKPVTKKGDKNSTTVVAKVANAVAADF